MLANKLGWLDVDAMLDNMTPEQFRERFAHWLIEPYGDEWRQAATIAASNHDAISTYMAAKSGKKPHTFNPLDLMPIPQWLREMWTPKKYMTDEESEANLS